MGNARSPFFFVVLMFLVCWRDDNGTRAQHQPDSEHSCASQKPIAVSPQRKCRRHESVILLSVHHSPCPAETQRSQCLSRRMTLTPTGTVGCRACRARSCFRFCDQPCNMVFRPVFLRIPTTIASTTSVHTTATTHIHVLSGAPRHEECW